MNAHATALVGLLMVLAGCTTSEGYEAVRAAGEAKARCQQELTVAAQRACEERYQQDYDEYARQRREAVDDGSGAANGG